MVAEGAYGMSEITKIAEKAADEIYGCVDTDGFGGIMFDRAKIAKIIEEAARAAIDAYEAAKKADFDSMLDPDAEWFKP